MGHLLRFIHLYRASKIFATARQSESFRKISLFPRALFPVKSGSEHETSSETSPSSSQIVSDESFPPDLLKFQNEDKINMPRSAVKVEDFDLGPPGDPDVFGTLSPKNPYLLDISEGAEEDKMEMDYTSELPNFLPQKEYAKKIKKFLNQRRFTDALNVLQITMLQEDRVVPEYYIYSILISYCGVTGYSKMAFKLYNDMKKRNLKITPSIYTSLFNSFANCPFPSDGVKRTKHLLQIMNEKNITPNIINCRAIIKAFGRCGAVEEAFQFVDYMMQKKYALDSETFSFLFQTCISDKEAGFRHALFVYKKMQNYKIIPNTIHFNLILRCIRDCSIGDHLSVIDLLKKIGVENIDHLSAIKKLENSSSEGYPWDEDESFSSMVVAGSCLDSQPKRLNSFEEGKSSVSVLPNLFSHPPTLGCIVSLSEIQEPQDRLLLVGGVQGYLEEMAKHNAQPDIKSLNLLLDCCPKTCSAEEALLNALRKLKVAPDVVFFNTLIRRRCRRWQYAEARDVLPLMSEYGLQPNIVTFTDLAMACRDMPAALELLKSLDTLGLRPSIALLSQLLSNASRIRHMKLVQLVFDVIDYEEIKVDEKFLKYSDNLYHSCQKTLKMPQGNFSPLTLKSMEKFCKMYPQWKNQVEVENNDEHPWQYLRDQNPPSSQTDDEFYTNFVEKDIFKSKLPRLGPETAPKKRNEKLKRLKDERRNLTDLGREDIKSSRVEKLEGISSVEFKKLLPS